MFHQDFLALLILLFVRFNEVKRTLISIIESFLRYITAGMANSLVRIFTELLQVFYLLMYIQHITICFYIRYFVTDPLELNNQVDTYIDEFFFLLHTSFTIGYQNQWIGSVV